MLWFWLTLTQTVCAAVLGIDYGAQFVKSNLVAPNSPFEIVLTPDSQRKDASGLVIKPEDGERVYGTAGAALISKFPESSIFYMKSLLGLPFEDPKVAEYSENHLGLKLVPTNRSTVGFEVNNEVYPIEEITAMQFNDILSRSTELLRSKTKSRTAKVNDVAISVPGSFGITQRQALVDALGLTGTNLIGLVNDGIAVALNYANSPVVSSKISEDKHYVIVYDSGSSVTSSTLISLRLSPKDNSTIQVEVEGFGSSDELSGFKLTNVVRDLILSKFIETNGEFEKTGRVLGQAVREAERAKHVLSANSEVHVFIESFANGKDLDVKITREEFETAAQRAVQAVTEPIDKCLSGFKNDFDAVVLAGGVTRTPFVLSQLQSKVGESKISKNVNADEAITQGTSLRGVGISGIFKSKKKFAVLDRSTHTYKVSFDDEELTTPVFNKRSYYGKDKLIELPHNIKQAVLYEDDTPVALFNMSNVESTINSLHDTGTAMTCIDKETSLVAKFQMDINGIVKLKSVDAVCKAVVSEPSSTGDTESESESGTESSTDVESATDSPVESESATETSVDASASTEASTEASTPKTKLKSRRVAVYTNWVSPPVGIREQIALKAHLKKLNDEDSGRKEYNLIHHLLESILYRIRGFAEEDDVETIGAANEMLEWMETNKGNVTELQDKYNRAEEIYKALLSSDDDEEAPELEADDDTESESDLDNQPETEDDLSGQEEESVTVPVESAESVESAEESVESAESTSTTLADHEEL